MKKLITIICLLTSVIVSAQTGSTRPHKGYWQWDKTITDSGWINAQLSVANKFVVNNSGNITKLNNVTTSFPSSNSAGVLTNNGSGTLTWAAAGGGSPAGNFGNLQINRNSLFTTPASDSLNFSGGLAVKGTGSFTGNIGVGVAAGSQFGVLIQSSTTNGSALYVDGTVSPAAGVSAHITNSAGTLVEAGSGNHALFAGLVVSAPIITSGAATITNTSSLYVPTSPTATVSGRNYALWVGGGGAAASRFDGSIMYSYAAKTSTYTITDIDYTIDCTSGTFTVTLPLSTSMAGRVYNIVNSGAGVVTIATTSSETFKNVVGTPTTLVLSAVGTYTVQATGSGWIVL